MSNVNAHDSDEGKTHHPVQGSGVDKRERVAERAADIRREDDALDTPYGDASKVKNRGVLDSIGRAITEPVRDAAEEAEKPLDKA